MGYPATDITADGTVSQERPAGTRIDASGDPATGAGAGADLRGAKRYTSLIRSAKLISAQGEFVCVIRDVSSTGIGLRAFHRLPGGERVALELQNGDIFELRKVRSEGREGSYTFETPIPVESLIKENWNYPKRQLRLNLAIPLTISALTGRGEAITQNLSQQGARIECDLPFAIDQTVRLDGGAHFGARSGGGRPEIRAKVRWRKGDNYGLVFDTTFALQDFARIAAAMQCPGLLDGTEF